MNTPASDNPIVLTPKPARQVLADGRILLHAPAKINLNLMVGPLRDDGFHPVDSLIAKIALYDEIYITPRTDGQITFAATGVDCGDDEKNLALRAARCLAHLGTIGGADIQLQKNILPGRGLGGGSSDAASVLRELNALWKLDLPVERLHGLAAELGSDVPLFLGTPASRVTGRGEILQPYRVREFAIVLIQADLMCPTAPIYKAYDQAPVELGNQLAEFMVAEHSPTAWTGQLVNDLTAAAWRVCPELAELHQRLTESLDIPVHMTGSGSALFVLLNDVAQAENVWKKLPADVQDISKVVPSNPW